jgi:predicted alpha/beta superfamily hydrolase
VQQSARTVFRISVLLALCQGSLPGALLAQADGTKINVGERIALYSEVLDEEREIVVRLPEDYGRTSRRFPVLYTLDGEYFFLQTVAAVQFLSELGYQGGQHPIPQMVVVGIINVDRDRDYTPTHAPSQSQGRLSFPTSGGAGAFTDFLEQELLPFVEANYQVHPYRIITGWSLGGEFTVHTFLERPAVFSAYLAVSPSLWWDDSVTIRRARRLVGDSRVSRKPLVVTLGGLEGGDMDRAVRRNFVPLLRGRGSSDRDFTYIEIPDEGHTYVPYKAPYEGLKALFADWLVPSEVLAGGLPSVEAFYARLSAQYGYQVDVPLSAYRRLSTTIPDVEAAMEAARLAVQHYPYSSEAHAGLGRLQQLNGELDAARESYTKALEFELASPNPYSERLRAFRRRLDALERR